MSTKQITYCGLMTALAVLMGYVEMLIPMPIPVPGVKLGLANVVIVITLYFMGSRTAFTLSMIRIVLSALLFAGFAGFLYSLAGGILSFLAMAALKKTRLCGISGVSVAGAVCHNIGQLVTACLVVENSRLLSYLPVLLVSGVITGLLIGIVAAQALPYLNRKF